MASTQLRKCFWLALLLTSGAGAAHATTLYSGTLLASGPEFLTSLELPVLEPQGEYKVTVTDLKWFNTPAQALSFGVFTAAGPVKTSPTAGTLQFFKGPGKVSLLVYAKLGGPRFADLFGLTVEDTVVVALPSSFLLLASALGGSVLLKRRRRIRSAAGAVLDGARV
ncbi:MAG TPA: hypothetical protein VE907_14760 [Gammaproteobacteria bacterium]|nr:hypothetical protein [Gammaproteobacteria bacterium]